MKKGIHQYHNLEKGAVDVALILSFVAFLLSLVAVFFYFSFDKNYRATAPSRIAQEEEQKQEPVAVPIQLQEPVVLLTPTTIPEKGNVTVVPPLKESSVSVFIGSYGDIKKEYLEGIQTSVKKATGAQVTVLESAKAVTKKVPLYNASRQQFDADVLLKGVETASLEYGAKNRFIFVFDVDMYSSSNPNLKSVWYAGTKGKNVSIVSLSALLKKSDTDATQALSSLIISRLQKNSLHMIGANIGIPSSADTKCIMYPAKNLAELDAQGTSYCGPEQSMINTAFSQ